MTITQLEIRLPVREQLLHALRWLGDSWAERTTSGPQDVVEFYAVRSLAIPKTKTLVRRCPYCGEPVTLAGPDSIDFCRACEVITEGETLLPYEE